MSWPQAFVAVGGFVSAAFIVWAILHYGRTTVEVRSVKERTEKKDPEA